MASKAGGGEHAPASGVPISQPARRFSDASTEGGSTGEASLRSAPSMLWRTTSMPPHLSEDHDGELANHRAVCNAPSPWAPADSASHGPPEHGGGAGPDPGRSGARSFAELARQVDQLAKGNKELARDNEELKELKRRVEALEQVGRQEPAQKLNNPSRPQASACSQASAWSQVALDGVKMDCVMEYEFEESVWDTAVFVGHRSLGHGASFLLLIALALSVSCQLVFSYVVMEHMTENDFMAEGAVEGLRQWRQNAGHSVQNIGTVSLSSLTARVCADPVDMSLEMSTRQQDVVDDIRSYLGTTSALNGPSLCVLAVLLFVMYIVKDVSDTLRMVQGVYSRTVWKKTTKFLANAADNAPAGMHGVAKGEIEMYVDRISGPRFVFVVFLGILRICVAGFLCYAGIPFLVQTGSLEDLILNALALTCILEFDEVVYTVLVPTIAMETINCIKPLRWKSKRLHIAGADHLVLSRLVIVTVCILLVWTQMIVPFKDDLGEVRDAICGDPVDVVYAVNPRSGQVEWAPSIPSEVASSSRPRNNYKTEAVLEILEYEEALSNETTFPLSMRSALDRVVMIPTLGVGDPMLMDNNACTDRLEHYWLVGPETSFPRDTKYGQTRKILSSAVGVGVDFCSNVTLADCDDFFKPQVRTLCPRRCGCHDPRSGLFPASQNQGCPSSCLTKEHRQSLAALPCTDTPVEVLRSDPAWKRLWDGEARYLHDINVFHANRGAFELVGCDVIRTQPYNYGWCSELGSPLGWTFSLRPWCPQACGCEGVLGGSCPGQCMNTKTSARAGAFEAAVQAVAGVLNCPDVVHEEEAICEFSVNAVKYNFQQPMAVSCCGVIQQLLDEFLVVGLNLTFTTAQKTTMCCANCVEKVFDDLYSKAVLNGVGIFEETLCA